MENLSAKIEISLEYPKETSLNVLSTSLHISAVSIESTIDILLQNVSKKLVLFFKHSSE